MPINRHRWSGGGGAGGGSGGDVDGPASSTDNAVARFDGVTGKLLQDSAVTVSDVAAGVVTIATTAGNALTVDVLEPVATTGAAVAGDPLVAQAGDAVASTDTAGAAAGGSATIRGGSAARLTSGNAAGGDVIAIPGEPIGTGLPGLLWLNPASAASDQVFNTPRFAINRGKSSGLGAYEATNLIFFVNNNGYMQLRTGDSSVTMLTGVSLNFGAANLSAAGNVGLSQVATGVLRVNNASSGVGSLLNGVLVEANTAGSGAPNVLTAAESGTHLTNEGSSAENYHTLPTAAAGYEFTFIVQDADGIRITAAAGDTIRPIAGTAASATGGFIRCATLGAFIRLVSVNATEWIATGSAGVWTIDV